VRVEHWRGQAKRASLAAAFFLAAPLLLIAAPFVLVVAIAADVGEARRDLPKSRLVLMAVNYIVLEWIGIGAAGVLWLMTGLGRFIGRPWSQRIHRSVQGWWAHSMTSAARRWLGLRFVVENPEVLAGGRVIVAAQHASFFDALLPTFLLRPSEPRPTRHVLKRELGFDPCLGIYGHRQPNHFVDRSSRDGDVELCAIRDLASTAGDASLVIFPEGTFRSATNPDRVFAHLAEESPDRSVRLRLKHLLPVRPGGLLTLLRGAPDHDLVFVAHKGLEHAGSFRAIADAVPFRSPIRVRLWRTSADSLRADSGDALEQIDASWQLMDDWIAEVEEISARLHLDGVAGS
jgi:1-acyl-sn-glycerol-3-phosphate acyltransferase